MNDKNMLIKTPEEAIETIKSNMPTSGYQMLREALGMAIEALEKQIPKEIYHQKWNGIDGVPYDLCPTCENNLCTTGVFARNKMNYCEKCGQKLCWNEDMIHQYAQLHFCNKEAIDRMESSDHERILQKDVSTEKN